MTKFRKFEIGWRTVEIIKLTKNNYKKIIEILNRQGINCVRAYIKGTICFLNYVKDSTAGLLIYTSDGPIFVYDGMIITKNGNEIEAYDENEFNELMQLSSKNGI
jgi:hypothetical protein